MNYSDNLKPNFEYKIQESTFKNRRAEIVAEFVKHINIERKGTKYKPITDKLVALRLNANKKTAKDDDECQYLLNECLRKKSFSTFFWCCPLPITRYEK